MFPKNNTSASSFDSNNICTTQSYLTLFEKFQTAILPHLGWNGKEDYVLWKCLKEKLLCSLYEVKKYCSADICVITQLIEQPSECYIIGSNYDWCNAGLMDEELWWISIVHWTWKIYQWSKIWVGLQKVKSLIEFCVIA